MLEQIVRILRKRTLLREMKDDVAIKEENAGKHCGQVTTSACAALVLLKKGYWISRTFSLTYSSYGSDVMGIYVTATGKQHRK